ncbi:DUF1963 domain-containing protein [Deinococcus aquaticus]
MSMTREHLQKDVQKATGSNAPSILARTAIPAVEFVQTKPSPQLKSHQGGLPHGVTRWPEHAGQPQLFLLAVRLSDLKAVQNLDLLPPEGWLNFFMAPDVMTGAAPLTACAVVFTPDEAAPPLKAPAQNLTGMNVTLKWIRDAHHVPQAHEFATQGEYEAAAAEMNAINNLENAYADPKVHAHNTNSYLLGKQWYANPLRLRTDRDVAAFTREQHGRDDTQLQSLLTLTRVGGQWPFFEGTRVVSVTFFIETSDLHAWQFDRVIVDVASL